MWEPTELWPPDRTDKAVSAEPGRPNLMCLKTGGALEEGEEENSDRSGLLVNKVGPLKGSANKN